MKSNYQIITDKYEIYKTAIESSLSEHKDIIHIDFADVRYLCNDMCIKMVVKQYVADMNNEDWVADFVQTIKDSEIPLEKIKGFLVDGIFRKDKAIEDIKKVCMSLYNNILDAEYVWGIHHNPNLEYDLELDCMLFFKKDDNEEKENKEIFDEILEKTLQKFQPKEPIKFTL